VLDHATEQLAHVVGDVRAVVALGQRAGDLLERAPAVAQLEHVRRRLVQAHGSLRNQQEVLLAHVVVLKARAVNQAGAVHAAASG
jgi:hypothetical protein